MELEKKVVDEYTSQLTGDAKEWTTMFVEHMRKHYPQLEEVISFKMPTYKLGSGSNRNYIAFGIAQHHFSLHTTDFEYIVQLKTKLKHGGKGKGCVNVKFTSNDEIDILFLAIHDIYERHLHKISVSAC